MTFANPHILWLLLAIPPALLAFFWWAGRTRQRLLTQFIQARLLPALTIGISATRQKIRVGCLVMAVVCLILALARPQWGFDWEEMKLRGLDIVVAIDTSKSMLAEDIAPNRLARAKLAALELMQRARSDRLGLVAFAGSAFLQCPLTIDDAAFRQSVEALNVNIIPLGGTAIAEAIETALTAFKEGDNYKVLVLFTDGEDHDSGALEAAEKAAKAGLRIFTIGIGTAEGELLRIKDAQGGSDYIRDEQGNVVKSHLNERLLQQIAGATEGGFYLPLRGAKAIDTLYDQGLAKLPKSQHQEKLVRRYHERYHWPLAVAIVLLLVEMLFPERKRESKAKPAVAPSAQSALGTATTVLLLLLLPTALRGSPASALREYKAGEYEQALKEYQHLLERKGDDPRLHFNAGAAAYRNRQFEEAAKQFNATLASPDLKLQGLAYYNEGNALYHLGERNPDPKKRTESWEKALTDYQSTVKLNPQDADAKFNYEFVKRKLEELKQQQQQSQQNKSDQQKNQDQQQQQQNQQKNDQQQQQQAQQNQSEQKKDSSQQEQQAQQKKQEDQQQAANQSQEQKDQPQPAQQSPEQPKDKGDEKEQEAAAAQAAGQMTPQQAQQLLDSQKGEEQMLPPQSTGKPVDRSRPIKDW
ncbi:MAG: VWA domain-containing protein [Verrucomicrobiota bacterium]|jgi:Ca-activated chloride channel family protein